MPWCVMIKFTLWVSNYTLDISIKKHSFYQILLLALNVYKLLDGFTYDALGIYNTLTMMEIRKWTKSLVVLFDNNSLMQDNKTHRLGFKLYTHH